MGDREDGKRRRLEGVIPDILKRAVEAGVSQAQHAPENIKTFIGDLKVPKDIASYIFSQVDETKNGLFRVVAKEMRDFLEHTNIAGEMQKLLTTVQFEVNTTIRFRPNEPAPTDGSDAEEGDKPGLSKPEVKTEVTMSRAAARGARERRRRERPGRAAASTGTSGGEDGGGGTTSGGDE
jgi:hypothetical protein